MAFGAIVKSAKDSAFGSTLTPDLGSNPTTGNLLIATFSSNSAAVVATPPSGFTQLHSVVGSGTWVWYYKVSVGTEQTASQVWTGSEGCQAVYAEYEWDGSTPTVTKNDDQTNITSSVNTQASGAATPTTSNNICIAGHGAQQASAQEASQAIDGSWVEDIAFGTSGRGEMKISSLVNVTGSQEATHTDSDTGLAMYGAIAIFDVPSGGGIVVFRRRINGY